MLTDLDRMIENIRRLKPPGNKMCRIKKIYIMFDMFLSLFTIKLIFPI